MPVSLALDGCDQRFFVGVNMVFVGFWWVLKLEISHSCFGQTALDIAASHRALAARDFTRPSVPALWDLMRKAAGCGWGIFPGSWRAKLGKQWCWIMGNHCKYWIDLLRGQNSEGTRFFFALFAIIYTVSFFWGAHFWPIPTFESWHITHIQSPNDVQLLVFGKVLNRRRRMNNIEKGRSNTREDTLRPRRGRKATKTY